MTELLGVPAAKVAGVASFYHFFRLAPRGKFIINVCMGTACYVKGADRIAQRLIDELGITWGETSKDGVFTMEQARCLGTCGLAPVLTIAEDMHGQVTPDQVPEILEKFPDVVYIVLGATHPNELREHGEAYRVSLEMLAKKKPSAIARPSPLVEPVTTATLPDRSNSAAGATMSPPR